MATILDALSDPRLFGSQFSGGSWANWRAFLCALMGLPLTDDQLELYRKLTGRERLPEGAFGEAWVLVGRRGGKSRIAALLAVYLAVFRDYDHVLAPGERGVLPVLAADRRQARTIFRYVEGLIDAVPMLQRMVVNRTKEAIEFSNRIDIEIHTASYRSVRGYTVVAAICDETAFWRTDDSANPDTEILRALRPSMAGVQGALLLAITTPYARRGEAWKAYERHYGRDDSPVLVWQAPTRVMNPLIPEPLIEDAFADDPVAAAAEYGAEFRSDIESFVSREAVEACVVPGRFELPPVGGVQYSGFCDPSGGAQDSMTLAVAHREDEAAVLDAVREVQPPFSPEGVVEEFSKLLRTYRVYRVDGDRYAGEWPREQFRKHGVEYRPAETPKSDMYRDLLPLINSGRVALLDNSKLIAQLLGLERRTSRAGKDSIDHRLGSHDDIANAVTGALIEAAGNQTLDLSGLIASNDALRRTSPFHDPWSVTGRGSGSRWRP